MNGLLLAMHPTHEAAWLRALAAIREGRDPEVALAAAGFSAKPAPDPVREGATVVVPVRGMIGPTGLGWPQTASDRLADMTRNFADDPKVGAIVLDIQSYGGYVYGTQEAGDAIFAARASKPVVAVANTFAFSAAYWLATQAGEFWATPSGEVGSVGVRSAHVDESGFWESMGVKFTLIASHPDKIAANPFAPISEEDLADAQAHVDESHRAFVAAIARGRGMAAGEVAAVHGQGRTFSAQRALANGAIDGIATLRDVVSRLSSSRTRLSMMRRQAEAQAQAAAI